MERFEAFAADHAEWSQATFGSDNVRDWTGPLAHLRRELVEIEQQPDDIMEWADALLLLLDASRRAGIHAGTLLGAAEHKLAVNRERTWQPPNVDGSIEHVRTQPDVVVGATAATATQENDGWTYPSDFGSADPAPEGFTLAVEYDGSGLERRWRYVRTQPDRHLPADVEAGAIAAGIDIGPKYACGNYPEVGDLIAHGTRARRYLVTAINDNPGKYVLACGDYLMPRYGLKNVVLIARHGVPAPRKPSE
jgi:hypothetical protein